MFKEAILRAVLLQVVDYNTNRSGLRCYTQNRCTAARSDPGYHNPNQCITTRSDPGFSATNRSTWGSSININLIMAVTKTVTCRL